MEKTEIGGGGDPLTGDAKQFVMVACGRQDPGTLGLDKTVNIYADA
jgi:predicted lipid carrier protein YhbT